MNDKPTPPSLPVGVNKASMTELVPFASHKIHLFRNKFFIPGFLIAVTAVVFLMMPTDNTIGLWLLADYFMFTLFCVIYFYVEIDRPLSLYIIPVAIIYIVMQVPMWIYPASCPSGLCGRSVTLWYGIYYAFDALWQGIGLKIVGAGNSVPQNVASMFAQPGLREEFVKAIPALIAAGLTVAEAPAIYALAILLPPVGLLVSGQRKTAIISFILVAVCIFLVIATRTYVPLLILPLQAVIAVAIHRRHRDPNAKPSKLHELLRLRDPLDGLMIGIASGLTFTLLENMSQYIPEAGRAAQQHGGHDTQVLSELLLLIPRSLDSIIAHFAWAGISGYFIGLIVLRPQGWPLMLALGWLVPAFLHGAFDGLLTSNLDWWVLPLDLVSFILFLACLLKARQLHMALFEDGKTAQRE
ncbi:MAG TPA: PrsW family glutamic-type intramembrane protease [Methylovirgula sp.]|nr:PrsW family glutamic-type intramembrane protease [Methylovirgula sp.]